MLLPDGATMALRNSAIEDSKRHWCFMYDAMSSLCSPTVVMAAADAALRVTAMHWGFEETTAMEAVMAKCEERLPLTFGNARPGLGVVLAVVAPDATDIIWKLMKKLRVASTGSSSHIDEVTGKYANMAEANAAWSMHYEQRRVTQCQRRNRQVQDATNTTASEITELFAEFDHTKQHGFEAASLGVADEAGDVWYGARCYAIAYTEQTALAVHTWRKNFKHAVSSATGSSGGH